MEQCIFDLGIISYNPVITWTVPVVFFLLAIINDINLHN
ncbi:putative integral membrane protein [Escherichia coli]|nr:putative integral membrane protein [Escherichia coli]SQM74626.1 putative integral membrane protein [Escherichia coli]